MPAAIPAPSATRTRVERDTRRTYRRELRTTNRLEGGQKRAASGGDRSRPSRTGQTIQSVRQPICCSGSPCRGFRSPASASSHLCLAATGSCPAENRRSLNHPFHRRCFRCPAFHSFRRQASSRPMDSDCSCRPNSLGFLTYSDCSDCSDLCRQDYCGRFRGPPWSFLRS
jgi:hypothetical protein